MAVPIAKWTAQTYSSCLTLLQVITTSSGRGLRRFSKFLRTLLFTKPYSWYLTAVKISSTESSLRSTSETVKNLSLISNQFWEAAVGRRSQGPWKPNKQECLLLKELFRSQGYRLLVQVLLNCRVEVLVRLEGVKDWSEVKELHGRAAMLRFLDLIPNQIEIGLEELLQQEQLARLKQEQENLRYARR